MTNFNKLTRRDFKNVSPVATIRLPPMKGATNYSTASTGSSLAAVLANLDPFGYTQAELAKYKVPLQMAASVPAHYWAIR